MTPAKRRGLSVGDLVVYVGSRKELSNKIFTLIKDDVSLCPFFICNEPVEGYEKGYIFCHPLECVTPVGLQENE